MAEFKVPVLPLRKSLIGPKLPPSETEHEVPSASEEKHARNDKDGKEHSATRENDSTNDTNRLGVASEEKVPHEPPPDMKLSYSEPAWGGEPPPGVYQLLVIKNGVEIDTVNLSNRSFCLCGRLPSCDIHLEHPSISRHHAILQYRPQTDPTASSSDQSATILFSNTPREAGFYLYDLGSTHGTYLTKNQLPPRCYCRMRVGQSVKFGGSSRLFVLDQISESGQEIIEAEAVEEIAEITRKKEEYNELVMKAEEEERRRAQEQEEMGATWGMVMDDIPDHEKESADIELDPQREAYYLNDPKKALRTFFEREGLDLDYENEETGPNHGKTYTIKVWLPIYTSTGEPVYATGSVKGNKKAAVAECALEACRLLDAEGILRESNHSRKKKLKTLEDNDYYDSDEDNYLDRTGDVERKRKRRMIRAGKISETVETYQSLADKLSVVQKELKQLENKLKHHNRNRGVTGSGKEDSLDNYMRTVPGQLDSSAVTEIKLKIQQLQKEEANLTKLVKVAAPYQLPGSSTVPPISPDPVQPQSAITIPHEEKHSMITGDSKERRWSHGSDEDKEEPTEMRKKAGDVSSEVEKSSPAQYGLILSSDLRNNDDDDGIDTPRQPMEQPTRKRRRHRMMGPTIPQEVKKEIEKEAKWSSDFDPEFASWIPPENQTGDGRTSLNEKLGY